MFMDMKLKQLNGLLGEKHGDVAGWGYFLTPPRSVMYFIVRRRNFLISFIKNPWEEKLQSKAVII